MLRLLLPKSERFTSHPMFAIAFCNFALCEDHCKRLAMEVCVHSQEVRRGENYISMENDSVDHYHLFKYMLPHIIT
jgi:predicted metal-binding protein